MTAADDDSAHADLLAKDARIDTLVAQAAKLVADLNATVADMKQILTHAARNVVEQQQISAELNDGVLTLTLKKAKEALPRQIAIN